ncbi:ATP-grasp domain-containing protein [Pseudactinotalea sp. Z1739]|uniref:ATP-grasp domain-containing protein n=1 Tax=Pseudactinotalea sp. Z1739 TaxID=3413028 RepID=UPI003C7D361B
MPESRVALVTCADLPRLHEEDRPLVPALADREVHAEAAVWNDPGVDWSTYDLVLVRSAWDYAAHRDDFVAWAQSVPRLLNPPNVLRWNTDKHYLQPLADHGLPVVDTRWLEPEREFTKRDLHNRFPAREEFVIKPAISAGSMDTARYRVLADDRRAAIEHASRLLADGRSVMVQRYVPEVDVLGEIALVFFHGTYSHAARKGTILEGAERAEAGRYLQEEMEPYRASREEIQAGQEVLAFARARIPGRSISSRPLPYARVDLIPTHGGASLLMELELVEPNLFCSLESGAIERFADSIVAELRMGPDPANIDLA